VAASPLVILLTDPDVLAGGEAVAQVALQKSSGASGVPPSSEGVFSQNAPMDRSVDTVFPRKRPEILRTIPGGFELLPPGELAQAMPVGPG
jgi:hypothetical protein